MREAFITLAIDHLKCGVLMREDLSQRLISSVLCHRRRWRQVKPTEQHNVVGGELFGGWGVDHGQVNLPCCEIGPEGVCELRFARLGRAKDGDTHGISVRFARKFRSA